MLLPYTTLTYYGPGAASMWVQDAGLGELQEASPRQDKAVGFAVDGLGDSVTLRPYRGRAFDLTVDGQGTLEATPHQNMRIGLSVLVSALSQDDVTGAVLENVVEGDLTVRQVLRLLLAHAAGDASGLDGNPVFKGMDGSTTRLAGTISGGARTITTRNPG